MMPLAQPVLSQQKMPTVERPVQTWVDQSLVQQATPWLPGDEARFQKGIKTPREGMNGVEKSGLVFLVLIGMIAAGWFLLKGA